MADTIALHDGTILSGVHEAGTCFGPHCCIHNPSDHPLRDAPLAWMGEPIRAMSRVCQHGFQHPDPDDIKFKILTLDWLTAEAIASVHLVAENCDGCCQASDDAEENPNDR